MRHSLVLPVALLTALLVASPLASAQSASLVLNLEPLEEPIVQGEAAVVRGTVRYVADATAYTHTMGVPLQYSIKNAPEWLSVSLSPHTDLLALSPVPHGATVEASAQLQVVLFAAPDAPVGTFEPLELVAQTPPSTFTHAAVGAASIPVVAAAAPDPCAEGTVAAQGAGATVVPTGGGAMLLMALAAAAAAGLAAFAASRRARLSRSAGVLLVLAAFALFVPTVASAQTSSVAIMAVHPSDEPLTPGEPREFRGELRIVTDATGAAELSGMQVRYEIKRAPEWATVMVMPQEDVVTFGMPQGFVNEAYVTFRLTVIPIADMAASELDVVEVVAHVDGQYHHASGLAAVPVLVKVPPVCEPVEETAALPDAPEDSDANEDLSVQSASTAEAVPVAPVLVACAVAGALVGLAVSRKLR